MPITFQLNPQHSVLLVRAAGIVTFDEIIDFLREKEEAGVFETPQLFDARDVQLDLSVQDLHRIAGEARRLLRSRKMGKIAVVTTSFYFQAIATAYAAITRQESPEFRIFKSLALARSWLGLPPDPDDDARV
jgi:hypothetical protein